VVCGTAGTRGGHEESWLKRVTAALKPVAEEILDENDAVIGWRRGTLPEVHAAADAGTEPPPPPPRALDLSPLPDEPLAPRPLSPSTAGGVHRLETAEDEEVEEEAATASLSPVLGLGPQRPSLAIRRGTAMHRLLQVLPEVPPGKRESAGAAHLRRVAPDIEDGERDAMLGQALAILADPGFAEAFAPGSRAEVSVAGTIALGPRQYAVSGTVDRLAVSPTEVLILDYKTTRPPAETLDDVPAPYILQLALYRRLLQPLYPKLALRAALLFTEGPNLIEVPGSAMDAALIKRSAVA
jgi:ATP-dependent helicase/nuclease subunit A